MDAGDVTECAHAVIIPPPPRDGLRRFCLRTTSAAAWRRSPRTVGGPGVGRGRDALPRSRSACAIQGARCGLRTPESRRDAPSPYVECGARVDSSRDVTLDVTAEGDELCRRRTASEQLHDERGCTVDRNTTRHELGQYAERYRNRLVGLNRSNR